MLVVGRHICCYVVVFADLLFLFIASEPIPVIHIDTDDTDEDTDSMSNGHRTVMSLEEIKLDVSKANY